MAPMMAPQTAQKKVTLNAAPLPQSGETDLLSGIMIDHPGADSHYEGMPEETLGLQPRGLQVHPQESDETQRLSQQDHDPEDPLLQSADDEDHKSEFNDNQSIRLPGILRAPSQGSTAAVESMHEKKSGNKPISKIMKITIITVCILLLLIAIVVPIVILNAKSKKDDGGEKKEENSKPVQALSETDLKRKQHDEERRWWASGKHVPTGGKFKVQQQKNFKNTKKATEKNKKVLSSKKTELEAVEVKPHDVDAAEIQQAELKKKSCNDKGGFLDQGLCKFNKGVQNLLQGKDEAKKKRDEEIEDNESKKAETHQEAEMKAEEAKLRGSEAELQEVKAELHESAAQSANGAPSSDTHASKAASSSDDVRKAASKAASSSPSRKRQTVRPSDSGHAPSDSLQPRSDMEMFLDSLGENDGAPFSTQGMLSDSKKYTKTQSDSSENTKTLSDWNKNTEPLLKRKTTDADTTQTATDDKPIAATADIQSKSTSSQISETPSETQHTASETTTKDPIGEAEEIPNEVPAAKEEIPSEVAATTNSESLGEAATVATTEITGEEGEAKTESPKKISESCNDPKKNFITRRWCKFNKGIGNRLGRREKGKGKKEEKKMMSDDMNEEEHQTTNHNVKKEEDTQTTNHNVKKEENSKTFFGKKPTPIEKVIEKTTLEAFIAARPSMIDGGRSLLTIAKQLSEWLIEVQKKNIIHNDIRPANLLISKKFGEASPDGTTKSRKVITKADFTNWGSCSSLVPHEKKSQCAVHPSYRSPRNPHHVESDDTFATAMVFAQMYIAGVSGAENHFPTSDTDLIRDLNTLITAYGANYSQDEYYLEKIVSMLAKYLETKETPENKKTASTASNPTASASPIVSASPIAASPNGIASPIAYTPIADTIGNLSHSILKMHSLSCINDMESENQKTGFPKYLNFANIQFFKTLANDRIAESHESETPKQDATPKPDAMPGKTETLKQDGLPCKTEGKSYECQILWHQAHKSLKKLLDFDENLSEKKIPLSSTKKFLGPLQCPISFSVSDLTTLRDLSQEIVDGPGIPTDDDDDDDIPLVVIKNSSQDEKDSTPITMEVQEGFQGGKTVTWQFDSENCKDMALVVVPDFIAKSTLKSTVNMNSNNYIFNRLSDTDSSTHAATDADSFTDADLATDAASTNTVTVLKNTSGILGFENWQHFSENWQHFSETEADFDSYSFRWVRKMDSSLAKWLSESSSVKSSASIQKNSVNQIESEKFEKETEQVNFLTSLTTIATQLTSGMVALSSDDVNLIHGNVNPKSIQLKFEKIQNGDKNGNKNSNKNSNPKVIEARLSNWDLSQPQAMSQPQVDDTFAFAMTLAELFFRGILKVFGPESELSQFFGTPSETHSEKTHSEKKKLNFQDMILSLEDNLKEDSDLNSTKMMLEEMQMTSDANPLIEAGKEDEAEEDVTTKLYAMMKLEAIGQLSYGILKMWDSECFVDMIPKSGPSSGSKKTDTSSGSEQADTSSGSKKESFLQTGALSSEDAKALKQANDGFYALLNQEAHSHALLNEMAHSPIMASEDSKKTNVPEMSSGSKDGASSEYWIRRPGATDTNTEQSNQNIQVGKKTLLKKNAASSTDSQKTSTKMSSNTMIKNDPKNDAKNDPISNFRYLTLARLAQHEKPDKEHKASETCEALWSKTRIALRNLSPFEGPKNQCPLKFSYPSLRNLADVTDEMLSQSSGEANSETWNHPDYPHGAVTFRRLNTPSAPNPPSSDGNHADRDDKSKNHNSAIVWGIEISDKLKTQKTKENQELANCQSMVLKVVGSAGSPTVSHEVMDALAALTKNYYQKEEPTGILGFHPWETFSKTDIFIRKQNAFQWMERMNHSGENLRSWMQKQRQQIGKKLDSGKSSESSKSDSESSLTQDFETIARHIMTGVIATGQYKPSLPKSESVPAIIHGDVRPENILLKFQKSTSASTIAEARISEARIADWDRAVLDPRVVSWDYGANKDDEKMKTKDLNFQMQSGKKSTDANRMRYMTPHNTIDDEFALVIVFAELYCTAMDYLFGGNSDHSGSATEKSAEKSASQAAKKSVFAGLDEKLKDYTREGETHQYRDSINEVAQYMVHVTTADSKSGSKPGLNTDGLNVIQAIGKWSTHMLLLWAHQCFEDIASTSRPDNYDKKLALITIRSTQLSQHCDNELDQSRHALGTLLVGKNEDERLEMENELKEQAKKADEELEAKKKENLVETHKSSKKADADQTKKTPGN